MTRLRFDLKDESKADDDYLKNRDGVVTIVKAGERSISGGHRPTMSLICGEYSKLAVFQQVVVLILTKVMRLKGVFLTALYLWFSSISNLSLVSWLAGDYQRDSCSWQLVACQLQRVPMYVILNAAGNGFFQFLPILLCFDICSSFQG